MDRYSMERWIMQRHEEMIRTAELRSQLSIIPQQRPRMSLWLADSLRHLADRLDGETRLEKLPQ